MASLNLTSAQLRGMRSAAHCDFYTFVGWMFYNRTGRRWLEGAHHKRICDALMLVYRGEINRLIINVPPRYGKTELMNNFISWTIGQHPYSANILTSYTATLATENSSVIRDIVTHPEYKAIFPSFGLRDDSQAKDYWKTTDGGHVYSSGAGGTITGFGAGVYGVRSWSGAFIIDDPHKAGEANSEVMRNKITRWMQETVTSRTNNLHTPVILIMQRLHENDLTGFLLNGGDGQKWHHVCIPAINEDGTALWHVKHDIATLRTMEMSMPYMFAGQYMQTPAPLDGGMFKPSQIEIIDALPSEKVTWVRGWDLGATVGGDPTCGAKIGKLQSGKLIIADIVHGDMGSDQRDAAIKNTAALDTVGTLVSMPQDPGQAGKTQILHLVRMLSGYRVKTSPESGSKVTRAEPFASQVNVGNVSMLRAGWNSQLIEELRLFPNGKYDDRVDALSRAYGELIGHRRLNIGSF